MKRIYDIAEENGLEWSLISENKAFIYGFETFEEAEKMAKKYGLSIEIFARNIGELSGFYETGKIAYKCFEKNFNYYDDDKDWEKYKLTNGDIEDFYDKQVKPFVSECSTFVELDFFIERKKELLKELEDLKEGEYLASRDGFNYTSTRVKLNTTQCMTLKKRYVIGLIDRN